MTKAPKPVLGYILKGYPRISETFISNEILRLEQLGFDIVIFAMRKPRENFHHQSVEKIGAEVHYLPTHLYRNFLSLLLPNIVVLCSSPQRYMRALKFACRRFARNKKQATFKHLLQAGFLISRLGRLQTQKRITHLHGHFAHSPTSVTMFASLLSDLPYSFTAHAKDIYTSNRQQLREKIETARFVVTCTQYNALYLEDIAATAATPIYCIYHGIDLDLFSADKARRPCSPPYALLTVARLTEKKGLPVLYQALAQLQKGGMLFKHILIGDGDDREKILQYIDQLGLTTHCRWLGTQTHEQVLDHFRHADLFVLSCQVAANGDRDGIPNVLVESLAMGVPAVSTEVSAIPELIEDGKTGLLAPQNDADRLAEAILLLLENAELRRHVIENGLASVVEKFDNSRNTVELADIFTSHAEI